MPFNLGSIFAEIGLNTQKLDQGLMAAQLKLSNADKSITSFGQKLTNSSTQLMVAGGLMAGSVLAVAAASVKMASQFETSMRNVNSISKLSETEFKALGESVVNISKKFPQTAKELADGLYDIASSGFQGADGLKVLEASASAASAGLTNTATSAKGITAVLNAFGLEADQAGAVADTMFRTVDKGVITFEELSSTVGDWVGMSKAANISFNEASGAIAYMTTKGISASEAGVSLQRMLTGIIKPSEDMAAMIKKAGFESGEMMLKTLGLTGSMKILNDETGGSITKLIDLIPEIRGVRGANALLGSGYESLTKFMGDFVDTTGSAAIALAEQSKSLEFQLKLLKNSASAIAIELGNRLLPSITQYVTAADKMTVANSENIANYIVLAGKMGALVSTVLLLGGAYGKLNLIATGASAGLLATTAQITLLIGSAIVLSDAIMKVKKSVDAEKDGADDLNAALDSLSVRMAVDEAQGKVTIETLDKHFTALDKLATKYPEIAKEVMALSDELTKGNITNVQAKDGVEDLYQKYFDMPAVMATYDKYMQEGTASTTEAIIATQEHENAIAACAAAYPKLSAAQVEEKVAQDEITAAMNEGAGAADSEAKSIDELRSAYNELITTLFDGINSSNSLQESQWAVEDATKAVEEAIKKYGEGSREAEQAQNGLDAANQKVIDSFYEVYTSLYTTKEAQDVAKQSAIEYGLKMLETGQWGEGAVISLAAQFGMSSGDIIKLADDMGIKIDYAVRNRFLNLEVGGAIRSAQEFQEALDNMKDKTIYIRTEYSTGYGGYGPPGGAMGGIVGYDTGGIVGMPQAASGMIVPQMGRSYIVKVEQDEVIANSSQQRNLAEWIMGKANSKPDKSNQGQPIQITNIFEIDGDVIYQKTSEYMFNGTKGNLIGSGIR